jgi:succinyl-CoA synthetase beta subunit
MDLLEYQGKEIFRSYGVPIPEGKPAKTASKVQQITEKFGSTVVVKAQVRVGGRGKAGGVKLAKSPTEAWTVADAILGMDIKGHTVGEVLVERAGDIAAEYYVSFMLDRGAKSYLGMCSVKGGMDIEQVAVEEPDFLAKVHIDPLVGLKASHLRSLLYGGKIPAEHHKAVGALIEKLYRAFVGSDAVLVEVNPLIITGAGEAVALDAKVTLDENAEYRHQDVFKKFKDFKSLPKQERAAKELGLGNFVALDGFVGVIGNGAGLTMSTLDVVAEAGGAPANFLDIGGGANAEVMANALGVILSDRKVKSVMVNIFGGITRCDEVARGILGAIEKLGDKALKPIVVRLDGTNAEEGRALLTQAAHPKVVPAATMLEAAARAVELAKKRRSA